MPQLKQKITSSLSTHVHRWVGMVQREDVPASTHTHETLKQHDLWDVSKTSYEP